ncbi:MAG: class I SAM-dependent methyltransferase [Kiritimatiellae bacterium]|nr:class I SAM-dependent methyltransferase [Kiritimatiellia bacterium]
MLDLGCGKVPLYGAYRDYVTDTICVDWENTQHKSEHVDFQCDLSKPLPFKDKEFDTIILSDVLEHVPEPEHLWKEMARILAAGGKILATLPFYYWLHEQPHDYYRFTEFALRRFAERSGLRLIQLEPIGGVPEILADIHAKQVQSLPLIGKGLATAIQCATKAFVRTPLGRRISGRTARSFPLAYGVIAERP